MYGGARRWARARPICACIYTTLVKQQMQRREIEKKKKSRHRIWLVEEKIKFCMLIHNNMGKAIENLSILCFMLHFWNGARARHLFKCSFVSQHLHLLSGFFFSFSYSLLRRPLIFFSFFEWMPTTTTMTCTDFSVHKCRLLTGTLPIPLLNSTAFLSIFRCCCCCCFSFPYVRTLVQLSKSHSVSLFLFCLPIEKYFVVKKNTQFNGGSFLSSYGSRPSLFQFHIIHTHTYVHDS